MNSTRHILIVVFCFHAVCCKKIQHNTTLALTEVVENRNSISSMEQERNELQALMKNRGVRVSNAQDIPFVLSPMTSPDSKDLCILLESMKEAGIQLAMPDSAHLGMGLWKIAPEDLDEANEILKIKDFIKTLPTLDFEVHEPSE